jgi:hypothetical protein
LAPTAFHRERVRSRFGERIRCLAEEIAGHPLPLSIELATGEMRPSPAPAVSVPARRVPDEAPPPVMAQADARSTQLIRPGQKSTSSQASSDTSNPPTRSKVSRRTTRLPEPSHGTSSRPIERPRSTPYIRCTQVPSGGAR